MHAAPASLFNNNHFLTCRVVLSHLFILTKVEKFTLLTRRIFYASDTHGTRVSRWQAGKKGSDELGTTHRLKASGVRLTFRSSLGLPGGWLRVNKASLSK